MKLRVIVEVTHQGHTERKMKTLTVPEKTMKLHAMLVEDVNDLNERVAADVMANAISAVAGPAAQKLDPMQMRGGPPKAGAAASPADKKMAEMLGLDLLEHIDQVDSRAPMGQSAAPAMPKPSGYGSGRR